MILTSCQRGRSKIRGNFEDSVFLPIIMYIFVIVLVTFVTSHIWDYDVICSKMRAKMRASKIIFLVLGW